jgi:NTP pyrophosphatase (non-canonical NTP hydrolase)
MAVGNNYDFREKNMNFDEYRDRARETADYPQNTTKEVLSYLGMGLAGESGEIANKLKKYLRGDFNLDEDRKRDLALEIGDCLWYLSEISHAIDYSFSEIAEMNIEKLSLRKLKNTIKGDGDNR